MSEKLDIVIAGAGRVGSRTASILDDYGHSVTVIEPNPDTCESLSEEYVATIIEGDATEPDVLEQADPDSADVIAALTGDSGTNFGVLSLAKRLVDDGDGVRTVMRTDSPNGEEYEDIVDEVIYPEGLGGLGAANAIIGANVRALEDGTGDLVILEIRIAADAPVAGKALESVTLPEGSLVVSDMRSDTIAGPETILEEGGAFIVATEPEVVDEVLQLFRG